ncbi:Conserved_hypothetical protein [Hexamita inflata]|uniref:Integrase catalytic domain-containing protein n=1 Tax=Hexamita inflata TaxID=28002 RepID=A0AA86Q8L3_9EUKA|nr:Conserved hypothetical protein [Hexamita inflata]
MPLTNKERQYSFINDFNTFQTDILFLNDSKHILETIDGPKYILVNYNPANHRLYIELLPDKSSESTVNAFKNFQQYITKFPDQQLDIVVSDSGSEFKLEYKQYLEQQNIEHRMINPNMKDNLILAPINSYCRYIRSWIQQKLLNKENQNIPLHTLVSDINDEHNYSRPINIYKNKFPADITLEDVKALNQIKKQHNDTVDTRDIFTIGDLVHVQLLKEDQLDKARVRKWSSSVYVIINKMSRFYQVSPFGFNAQLFEEQVGQDISIPVYFRKPYQLKLVQQTTNLPEYQPLEMESTMEFQIERIIKAFSPNQEEITNVNDFQKQPKAKYLVELYDGGRILVGINAFRNNNIFHKAELDFWFACQSKTPGMKYTISCNYL